MGGGGGGVHFAITPNRPLRHYAGTHCITILRQGIVKTLEKCQREVIVKGERKSAAANTDYPLIDPLQMMRHRFTFRVTEKTYMTCGQGVLYNRPSQCVTWRPNWRREK